MQRRAHIRFMLLISLLSVGMSFFLLVNPGHAAPADPISIISQSSTLNYPKTINFLANVHDSAGNIDQATLYIKYNQSFSYTEQHNVTAAHAGRDVTFTWLQNTTNEYYNPVGTTISYYWIVTDNLQNTETSRPQSLSITDNRFQWQQVSEPGFRVHWYGEDTPFGQMLATRVSTNMQRISQGLGVHVTRSIDVWVYNSEDDFHSSLSPRTHEWVGGIAFPGLGQCAIVATSSVDDTLRRDLPHELTHLIFHQQTRTEVPLWFDEGLAVYNQQFHEPDMTNSFNTALQNHSLLHLSDISSAFPADANAAYLAYAQSWQLLDYMYKTFGQQKMALLIQNLHQVDYSFDADLQQSIGIDTPHLENQWRIAFAQTPLAISNGNAGGITIATPQISLQDPLQPLLLTISILLIILPLSGCGIFLAVQSQRRKNWVTLTQMGQPPIPVSPFAPPVYTQQSYYQPPAPGYRQPEHYWSPQSPYEPRNSDGGHV